MKQIDKLAWIDKKIKNTFHPKFWKDKYYILVEKRSDETDLEALTREIKN
jgi:hypothetical protein